MSTTGDSPSEDRQTGEKPGLINRLLLRVMGPAEITPADDQDRAEQQAHADHEAERHPTDDAPR